MKTPQKLIIAIAIIALLVLGAVVYIKLDSQQKQIHSLTQANGMLANDITKYKHVNGKLLADNQAAELRAKEFKQALPELADALTKQMDVKMRNFRAGLVAEFRASGRGNSSISKIDTLYMHDTLRTTFEPFALTFDDGYLSFKSDVYNELNAPSEYTYGDTVKFSFNMQGKWFQRKQLFVSGALANPNAKILNSQGVLINEFKQKRFGVGPHLGIGIGADLRPQYQIGLSVHWSWIRF